MKRQNEPEPETRQVILTEPFEPVAGRWYNVRIVQEGERRYTIYVDTEARIEYVYEEPVEIGDAR